ncbi:MAG: SPOR domain-containing protein [Alphaproteobacteria bacterium]|nr:SPOR domain-containing protein [Alphaproteobacteria bacterium]
MKFAVHLASYKHEAEATKGWSQLQAKYPALKPMEARLARVDLGPKGVYYRLKAGPLSDQKAAETLCRQLKGAGVGYCNPEGFDGKPLGSS